MSQIPGGHVLSIATLITVPATTGAKSEETVPELLLMVPLEGVAASALLLGSTTVSAAIRPPTRTRVEGVKRSAMELPTGREVGCGKVFAPQPIVNPATRQAPPVAGSGRRFYGLVQRTMLVSLPGTPASEDRSRSSLCSMPSRLRSAARSVAPLHRERSAAVAVAARQAAEPLADPEPGCALEEKWPR